MSSLVGLLASTAALIQDWVTSPWSWLLFGGFLLAFGLSLWREMARPSFDASDDSLKRFIGDSGVLLALVALMAGGALVASLLAWRSAGDVLGRVDCASEVPISGSNSGVFSSAENRPELYPAGGRILISYAPSAVPPAVSGGDSVRFRYENRVAGSRIEAETVGGFVTFYEKGKRVDEFSSVEFSVRGATDGVPTQDVDLLLRLSLDDPELQSREREVVVRQSPTLQEMGVFVADSWQRVRVDLAEFDTYYFPHPDVPDDVDKVNKIAFVVDLNIAERIPEAVIEIRDVAFVRRDGRALCD